MKKNKGSTVILTIVIVLLAAICILSLTGCIILGIVAANSKKEASQPAMMEIDETITYSGEEVEELIAQAENIADARARDEIKAQIKEAASNSTSLIHTLRDLYPEDLVYLTSGHYEFCPISDNIPKATYDPMGIKVNEEGYMEYYEGEQLKSLKGIDVSKYQGKIDWDKVAAAGVDYAMIRIGIRGYESGALVLDDTCEDNIKGALQAGIPVGVYFFTQATTTEEALEEAHLVLETIAPYKITYPVAIDVEDVGKGTARTNGLTKEERTLYVKDFLDTVQSAGYTPMIYGNLKSFCGMLDMEQLNDYDKWFAYYDTYIYFPYEISMWQYTEAGAIDGITGQVDFNIMFPKKK